MDAFAQALLRLIEAGIPIAKWALVAHYAAKIVGYGVVLLVAYWGFLLGKYIIWHISKHSLLHQLIPGGSSQIDHEFRAQVKTLIQEVLARDEK